ncbi:hypothetical protein QYM36_008846 [Artemia franciscana]|uniref:Endonuclease/exonuclease/phosphatase domain-containing protein n=1 Tax=Artemia franciscana TaxID=6661 RepID=A0AA88L0J0_ARTSF|nr:hypothetical protein QYM36_008846 [Artemia franciscana]
MSKFTNVGNGLDRLEADPLDLKQILANDLVEEDFGNMDESVAALHKNKYINNNDIDHVATPGSFRSIFWNCRGLMSKIDFLSAFLPSHDILLIGVCEVFLSDNLSSSVQIQGDNFFEKSRVSKNKGGIGCYVRNDIHSRKITDFDDLYEEIKVQSLILQLKIHNEKVACCVCYKPPHVSPSSFSSALNTLMKLISCKYRRVILMGDFNINLIDDSHRTTDKEMNECRLSENAIDFLSMCLSHCLLPLCSIPTRVTATSASLIDNNYDEK